MYIPCPAFERRMLIKRGVRLVNTEAVEEETTLTPYELIMNMAKANTVKEHKVEPKVEKPLTAGEELMLKRKTNAGRKPAVILNEFVEYDLGDSDVDDLLVGCVRSVDAGASHKGQALVTSVLRAIMQRMPEISSKNIVKQYNMTDRHARRYMQGAALAHMMLERLNRASPLAFIGVDNSQADTCLSVRD